MTQDEIKNTVACCNVAGLAILVGEDGTRLYLQVSDGMWRGRKWMLSPHMTKGEVVSTALAAVLMWYEHEAREAFTYRGRAIYNPHVSLEELWERADNTETRAEPPKEAVCRYCRLPIISLDSDPRWQLRSSAPAPTGWHPPHVSCDRRKDGGEHEPAQEF